jgi:probable rRNA maturation factor
MIYINIYSSSRYQVDKKLLRKKAQIFLSSFNLDNVQVDISIVGQRKIKYLNETFLQHEGTTDVLSFPQYEKNKLNDFALPPNHPVPLGDVVIYFGEAVKVAKKKGKLVDEQIYYYLEHGLKHLLGYHHPE